MNAKGTTDLDRQVYVNRGCDPLQIFKGVSYTVTYQLYVKMIRSEGTIYKGDVIVLDDEGVTASFKGVAPRGIPCKAFNMVLQAAVEGRELNGPKAPASNLTASAVTAAAALPVAPRPPVVPTISSTAPVDAHGIEKLPVQKSPVKMEIKQTPPTANVQPSVSHRPPPQPKSDHKWKAALTIILEETGLSAD
ncbi:hypothetical protein UA08_05585 [Talaromyces atroroseus]|uniref:Uncharacterized protein n=1 Tax=Talaromyces atroroseus TaxID=1441469 RepID=A0A225AXE1_TALAT|nr:hypothetical protein UA08_05585 [Talaromyces atroroseus]OKL59125.1 hypothetical protein UA08_05585 [Talaromyces atroroseus]